MTNLSDSDQLIAVSRRRDVRVAPLSPAKLRKIGLQRIQNNDASGLHEPGHVPYREIARQGRHAASLGVGVERRAAQVVGIDAGRQQSMSPAELILMRDEFGFLTELSAAYLSTNRRETLWILELLRQRSDLI